MLRVKMPKYLGWILLALLLIELVFSIGMLAHFGLGFCLIWWALSVILGVMLLSAQKQQLLPQFMQLLAGGGAMRPLGLLWLVRPLLAALLLFLPGFFSDLLALLLLLPWPAPGKRPPVVNQPDDVLNGEFRRVETPPISLPKERS
jgi:UPF0716 protein FxsA